MNLHDQIEQFRKTKMLEALEKFSGCKKKAADYLQMSKSAFYGYCRAYQIGRKIKIEAQQ